jgi:hypothetical protein
MGGCDWEGTDVIGKRLMKGMKMQDLKGKNRVASKNE